MKKHIIRRIIPKMGAFAYKNPKYRILRYAIPNVPYEIPNVP